MSDDKKISVQRTIDASAQEIFDVLTLPSRHAQIDGSGTVRSDSKADRITATGQTFTMNMHAEHMGGDYQTDNHVTGYLDNKMVAWQTAPAGTEPKGWEWLWELESQGAGSTLVTLTYDWSKVTDKQLLQRVTFPMISKDQLEDSLSRLADAVSGS
ncbi:SRPBCC family protein [Arsenicicoccus dermatophilus]|uniref:SRPBCC family protein n=1 Tax=Arsenicicoccus dermatophilus TaxID=1076331 RepID=UPI0039172358